MKKSNKLNLDIIDKITAKRKGTPLPQPENYVTLLDYETEQEGKRYRDNGKYYINIKTGTGDILQSKWSPYAEKREQYRNKAVFTWRENKIRQTIKQKRNPKTRYFMETIKAKGGPNDGQIYYLKYRDTRGGQKSYNPFTGEEKKIKGREAIIHKLMKKYEFSEYEILTDKISGQDVQVLQLSGSQYGK